MTEEKAAVTFRETRTPKQISEVSGIPVSDLRASLSLLFESGPLDDDSELSPGDTVLVLAFHHLSLMGYPRDRITLMLRAFKYDITAFMGSDAPGKNLGLLIIHDNRFVMFEAASGYYDLVTAKRVPDGDLLLPVMVVSVSLTGLYLRTFSKTQNPPVEGEAQKPE
jgi:hypothetical protein